MDLQGSVTDQVKMPRGLQELLENERNTTVVLSGDPWVLLRRSSGGVKVIGELGMCCFCSNEIIVKQG